MPTDIFTIGKIEVTAQVKLANTISLKRKILAKFKLT